MLAGWPTVALVAAALCVGLVVWVWVALAKPWARWDTTDHGDGYDSSVDD